MKTPKLISLSKKILSDEKYKRDEQKKYLKEIQKQLKKKCKKIKAEIESADNRQDIKQLEKKLKIILVQRNKIVMALKELK